MAELDVGRKADRLVHVPGESMILQTKRDIILCRQGLEEVQLNSTSMFDLFKSAYCDVVHIKEHSVFLVTEDDKSIYY